MPRTSTSIATTGAALVTSKTVRRDSLEIGDLFQVNDKTYMHTGKRTMPPSGRRVTVQVGNQTVVHEVFPSLGTQGGKDVIGFQSIVVAGPVAPGEDGSAVSFNAGALVKHVGRADIVMRKFGA